MMLFDPPKNSNYMQGLKSIILAIFQKGPRESLTGFQKFFLFLDSYEFLAMLEGKLGVSPFVRIQYCKITV
jgi:hypothetical protein